MEILLLVMWHLILKQPPEYYSFKALSSEQNEWQFANNIFKVIFLTEKFRILIQISLSWFQTVQITESQQWFR